MTHDVISISSTIPVAQEWPTPLPLTQMATENIPYPIGVLPSMIQNAVTDYQKYGQQPLALIACSALSTISLACQSMANVARDTLLVSPLSLYFLVVANSGERKSAVDNTFSHAIRDWEQSVHERMIPQVHTAKTLHQAWSAERDGLLSRIRRASIDGLDTQGLKQQFMELMAEEPSIPLIPMLCFEDTTQEALAHHLTHGWPSASLWSDEGGIILNGHGMQGNATKFVALLNRLWDGKSFVAHRKTSTSFVMKHRRFSLNIMIQPVLLEHLLTKQQGINRQSGFLARCMLAYPISHMGARFYQEPPKSLPAIHAFHQQIHRCLTSSLSLDRTGCKQLPTLKLSKSAKATWVTFFNETEAGLIQENAWPLIKDFASKAAENAVRLAGLLHLFQGKTGDIMAETTEQAIEVTRWHLFEAKRIVGAETRNVANEDATKLLRWITDKGFSLVNTRTLQQLSPLRDKTKLNTALQKLISCCYIRETEKEGKTVFEINPVTSL